MSLPGHRQTNDFSTDPFLHYNPHQHAWVSFLRDNLPFQMLIHLQVPPAPTAANGQPEEDRREDSIPLPPSGVAGPGRVQHLHHFNVDYPLHTIAGVSSPIYLLPNLLLINHTRAIEYRICGTR